MNEDQTIVVAGAGAVGLAAGLALAQGGHDVTLVGPVDTRRTGQTIALLDASLKFLDGLGLRPQLAPHMSPLSTMRIIDDTGSLFRPPPVEFVASEIDLEAFGQNIEAADLIGVLAGAVRAHPRCTLLETQVTAFAFSETQTLVTLANGASLAARLIVGADGRKSLARRSAGISQRDWSYPQTALTAILAHKLPHEGASTEFHKRQGPFTLVPLRAAPDAPHRSSLVWMMRPQEAERRAKLDDARLALEIEEQCQSFLGAMRLEGPRGLWPIGGSLARSLTAPRLALVGEAAHSFPPIGAQGLNLSLRDVRDLAAALSHRNRSFDTTLSASPLRGRVRDGGRAIVEMTRPPPLSPPRRGEGDADGIDPGSPELLANYERARTRDVQLRSFAVDALNRSLLTDFMPVDFLRGAGLLALGQIGPLRRAAMRMGPAG